MARGIHLKELKSTDLEAIGVPDDGLPDAAAGENGRSLNILAEADPVLSRALDEVQQDLEDTLRLLDEALKTGASEQTYPSEARSDPECGDPG